MPNREELEKRLAARVRAHMDAKDEQELVDFEKFVELVEELGPDRVIKVVATAWEPGQPTYALFRAAEPDEVKRYQDQNKPRDGKPGDSVGSAKLLAKTCLRYPDGDGWKGMLETQPGMDVIAGLAIVNKAAGSVAQEGKS